jgi:hypothetical protein
MKFSDRYTLADGGYIGLPLLSCNDIGSGHVVFFMQNPCVIRLIAGTMASAIVSINFPSGEIVTAEVGFGTSKTQYFPLNDVFFANYVKKSPPTLADILTTATMSFGCYDSAGNEIGTSVINISIADVGGLLQWHADRPFEHLLPDTFVFSRAVGYGQNAIVVRIAGTAETVAVFDANNAIMDVATSQTNSGIPYGSAVAWNVNPYSRAGYVRLLDGNGDPLAESRIIWAEECQSDSVLMRWWSSVDGGYKARVAKIRRSSDRISATAEYSRMFTPSASKSAVGGFVAVFERLTPKDFEYYKDILSSGDVCIVTETNDGQGYAVSRIPVIVGGDYPTADAVSDVDLEFTVNYKNIVTF